ncbi:MAG: hypothetical protein OXE04_01020 [bacterium]|nr:hypothetical protein [bacterium]
MEEFSEEYLVEKLAALEKWADEVKPEELKPAPLESYAATAAWVNQFDEVNEALAGAVGDALARGLSWVQVADLLGVSEEAARKKYESRVLAQTA